MTLGLGAKDVRAYGVAGLLHDLGKVRVPKEILNKPGKLTDEEWKVMRRHPSDGARMIVASDKGLDLAAVVIRGAKEDQGVTALRDFGTAALLEPQEVEEADRRLRVGHPQHRVEKAHHSPLASGTLCVTGTGSSAIASRAALPIGPLLSNCAAWVQ